MLAVAPLHPQMEALVAAMADAPPLSSLTPAAARTAMAALEPLLGEGPSIAIREDIVLPSSGGDILARLLSPADPQGFIIYFHGGGWVLGTMAHVEAAARILANSSGCAILLVDYRLAPEFPYPAAIEDSHAALDWVNINMINLSGRRLPLIVAGDSAGGNLAALAAGWALDRKGPAIIGQLLFYPVTDCAFDTESYRRFASGSMLDLPTMQWFWDNYVPDPELRQSPEISPLRRTDLRGLPPAILITAGHDPLSSEVDAYRTALENADVHVTSRHYPDMAHGFATMPALIDAATSALTFAGSQISEWLTSNKLHNEQKAQNWDRIKDV